VRRFAQLDGWQRGENKKFDAFVEHKRKEREFEEFDQRVERAYLLALKDHKAEIWNGVKRKLARTNTKYTPTVLMETNRAIDERSRWLRDVFAQIDSDYRSNDETRQATAAADLTKALRSSSSDFMAHAYDQKAQQRRMGEKEKMQMEAELAADEMPDISEDEANRYANLKPRMASIEAALKEKYGLAGHRHWEQLQSIKDAEYVDKLDRAAEKYKELLAQHDAYEESTESHASKRLIARIHEGQVRFQTAMELEEERLKLIDAKESMDKERYEEQKQRRRAALLRAADWRDEGMSEAAIAQRLKQETFDRIVQGYAAKGAQQKDTTVAKKKAFLTIVDEMEARFEADDGTRAMQDGSQRKMSSDAKQELDKILSEADTLARDRAHAAVVEKEERAAAAQKRKPRDMAPAKGPNLQEKKRALWDIVNEDTWNDPFLVVHQARLDARATYSHVYAHTQPWNLRLGPKHLMKQGDSSNVSSNQSGKIYKRPGEEYMAYGWGMNKMLIHNLDDDPKNSYVQDGDGFARKDKETGQIDMFYERKAGRGLRWTGPRFYKLGIHEDMSKEESEMPAGYPKANATRWTPPSGTAGPAPQG
jgi:hypothetical protein